MTMSGNSAGNPQWSPDGKYLSFTAMRGENARSQIWVLNRITGGEAQQLTEVKQGVGNYEWSPDGKRIVLTLRDPGPEDEQPARPGGAPPAGPGPAGQRGRAQPPWVVDRLQFKQDGRGFLDRRRNHLYVFDVAGKKLTQITSGDYDDGQPAWSPDSKRIAFVSNRTAEPDANFNSDIFIVSADNTDQGKTLLQLTTNPGPDRSPEWSPDGKTIAYITATDVKNFWYATNYLATIELPGEAAARPAPRILTQKLDRNAGSPRYTRDGKFIYFSLEDSGEQHLARIPAGGGEITRVISGDQNVSALELGDGDALYVRLSDWQTPGDLYAWEGGKARRMTRVNEALMAKLTLSEPENIHFKSKDGTEIEGWIYKPVGYMPGVKHPTLLRIHGGPVSQYTASFNFEAQLFAANGYVVVMTNPRGSSGYGQAFSQAIFAAWGDKDYEDVMAGVEYAIAKGYADPDKLGVGGWSYGGILTNFVVGKTGRFKAAISGASLANATAMYGHDHYQRHYEAELGLPWQNRGVWDRNSPFFLVDKISTPTLWICGEVDWNVPLQNSEQMYQAMKRLGRTTQLIVYPGQSHGITRPAYQKDRYERYLAWYGKHIKGEEPPREKPQQQAAAPSSGTDGRDGAVIFDDHGYVIWDTRLPW
jgi:dipeptidyl aminopeptidase/acylaminoacyl peptidase